MTNFLAFFASSIEGFTFFLPGCSVWSPAVPNPGTEVALAHVGGVLPAAVHLSRGQSISTGSLALFVFTNPVQVSNSTHEHPTRSCALLLCLHDLCDLIQV